MPKYLPPNLIPLFNARPPLEFKEPPKKRKQPAYTGIAAFVGEFEDPKTTDFSQFTPGAESRLAKKKRQLEENKLKHEKELEEQRPLYKPAEDEKLTGDAYKTLFVGRLPYEVSEPILRKEFEVYGPVKHITLIYDKDGKPRGYGFIEFERDRDMRTAYKQAEGRRIMGRRILVDVERGRTAADWFPRRLGGGLGTPRPNLPPKIGKK